MIGAGIMPIADAWLHHGLLAAGWKWIWHQSRWNWHQSWPLNDQDEPRMVQGWIISDYPVFSGS